MKKIPGKYLGLPSAVLAVAGLTGFRETPPAKPPEHPNILLIMVDQMQTPPVGYGPTEGAVQELKDILSFRKVAAGNSYSQFFPGLLRLQKNAVVLKKHYTASAASVPSRCCIMTGEYPTVTGVTQTDGLFKSADDVPFLDSMEHPPLVTGSAKWDIKPIISGNGMFRNPGHPVTWNPGGLPTGKVRLPNLTVGPPIILGYTAMWCLPTIS